MSKINIEEIVKTKLDNYEMPYDNSWNEFEKKLNKTKVSFTKYYIAAAAILVVGLLSIPFLNNNKSKQKIKTPIVVSQENTDSVIKNNTKVKDDIKIVESSDKQNINTIQVVTDNTNEHSANNISENSTTENNKQIVENKEQVSDNSSEVNELKETKPVVNENLTANFKANTLTGCEPLTVYFTPENTENAEYTWRFSDGTTSKEKMPKHVFKKAGEFAVELIVKSLDTKNTIKSKKEKYITVNPNPKPEFTMSNDENIYYFDCPDNYNSVKWKINSKLISSEIDPEYEFKTIGKSEITLIVENEYHCKANYSKNVNIEPIFQMANAFTPDDNGDNELFGPVFENLDNYKYFLYIYDAYGKLIFKSNYANQAWNGKINNTNTIAPDGTYVWKMIIKDNFGNKQTKKGQVALRK